MHEYTTMQYIVHGKGQLNIFWMTLIVRISIEYINKIFYKLTIFNFVIWNISLYGSDILNNDMLNVKSSYKIKAQLLVALCDDELII